MEKALLKVTRFNNSDVIATSGDTPSPDPSSELTCSHKSHFFVTKDFGDGSTLGIYYDWENGKWIRRNPGNADIWNYSEAGLQSVVSATMYGMDGTICSNKRIHTDN